MGIEEGAVGSLYSKRDLQFYPGVSVLDQNNCPLVRKKELQAISLCLYVLHKVRSITQEKEGKGEKRGQVECVFYQKHLQLEGRKSKGRLLSMPEGGWQRIMAALGNLRQKPLFTFNSRLSTFHLVSEDSSRSQRNADGQLVVSTLLFPSQLAEFQTFAKNTLCQSHFKWMI